MAAGACFFYVLSVALHRTHGAQGAQGDGFQERGFAGVKEKKANFLHVVQWTAGNGHFEL